MLKGKHIVIGVTGGIAAYKVVDVVSRLKKLNAEITIIMTENASKFVTPLTFRSLSLNEVVVDMFAPPTKWEVEHIAIAQRADLFLIAPATANMIGKIAGGIADDMLSTVVMATKAPVWIAPAMNTGMYTNPIVQDNLKKLKSYGYHFIDPDEGRLACGDIGAGKLAQPEKIVEKIVDAFVKKDLVGKKFLITAGPTQEAIDPIRYITNHASGKMGYALAKDVVSRGGQVTLVSGPVNLLPPDGVNLIPVVSSQEMYQAVMDHLDSNDVVIKSAAVADYTPELYQDQKIKKQASDWQIPLKSTKDIALEIGKVKKNQIFVGFAAETENLLENGRRKIQKKGFDFIVCNDISKPGAGFKGDTNIVTIIDQKGQSQAYDQMSKSALATLIIDKVKTYMK